MRDDTLSLVELEQELRNPERTLLVAFLAEWWRPSDRMFEYVCSLAEHAGIKVIRADPMEAAVS